MINFVFGLDNDRIIYSMKITKISVEGLFHTFNHEVQFNHEGIVIIIGENGIGKTTILKIINSIFSKKFDFLFSIDFNQIKIDFLKGQWLLYKDEEGCLVIKNKKKRALFKVKPPRTDDDMLLFPHRFLSKIDEDERYDRRRDVIVSREEIIHRYGYDPLGQTEEIPQWFEDVIRDNPVIFIQTQRIYKADYDRRRDGKMLKHMVKAYSDDLVTLLQQNNALFTTESIQLDSTFPIRLLRALQEKRSVDIENLIEEINNLNKERTVLSSVGIIDKQNDEIIDNLLKVLKDPGALSILDLYIEDNKKKLAVFKDTARKLEILLGIINRRFKHKTLFIDKKDGFIIKSDVASREIDIINLSSGEQNELIIFYNLLFKTKPNDLVLIDEPEISLHIAWQQSLIADLKDIVKETGISLAISTHSPDIIGDNWNLVQTLSGDE